MERAIVTWGWDGEERCPCSPGRSGLSEGTAEAGSARRVPLPTAFRGPGPSSVWEVVKTRAVADTPSFHSGLSQNVLEVSV